MVGKKLFNLIEQICVYVLVITLGGMCIFIAAQVFYRFILDRPLSWTEEAARHLMIWSAFIGSAIGYRRNAHLGIDILVHYLETRGKRGVRTIRIVIDSLTIILSGLIIHFGISIVQRTMQQHSSALNIPMGYIYAAVPTGFLFIGIFGIERIMNYLRPGDGHGLLNGEET